MKMLRIQNKLDQVTLQALRLSSAEPLFVTIHWLPNSHQIEYNITSLVKRSLLTIYKTPTYLTVILQHRIPARKSHSAKLTT